MRVNGFALADRQQVNGGPTLAGSGDRSQQIGVVLGGTMAGHRDQQDLPGRGELAPQKRSAAHGLGARIQVDSVRDDNSRGGDATWERFGNCAGYRNRRCVASGGETKGPSTRRPQRCPHGVKCSDDAWGSTSPCGKTSDNGRQRPVRVHDGVPARPDERPQSPGGGQPNSVATTQ